MRPRLWCLTAAAERNEQQLTATEANTDNFFGSGVDSGCVEGLRSSPAARSLFASVQHPGTSGCVSCFGWSSSWFVWLVLLLDNGREDAQKASAGARFSGIKPLGLAGMCFPQFLM